VWIDGRWHFTEYYFPGRLDYAWFFADAGQASPDDRAHGIFAVSFRPAGTEPHRIAVALRHIGYKESHPRASVTRSFARTRALPDSVFLNDVLPYAVVDEVRDSWRPDFYARSARRAAAFAGGVVFYGDIGG